MLRTLRFLVARGLPLVAYLLLTFWSAWGIGGVLTAATLVWMVWPGSGRPDVPADLPTAVVTQEVVPPVTEATVLEGAVSPPKIPPRPETLPAVAQAATRPVPPPKSEKELFRETFLDPRFEGVDARYTHEVKLTPAQVKELTEGIEVLERAGDEFERVRGIYMELDLWISRSKIEEAFYARIKGGKGFKFPGLPELWTKYADKFGLELNLPEYVTQGYYLLRIKNLKGAVVRGRATEGDVKFVGHAIEYVHEIKEKMHARLANARRLEGYLKAEGMIGENPEVVARDRAQSVTAHERWEQSLQSMADDMLNRGDPGRAAQQQKERDEAEAYKLMQDLRRRY